MNRKRSVGYFSVCLAGLLFLGAQQAFAQSSTTAATGRAGQDQPTQDLATEVRQLRIAIQQLIVTTHRSQLMFERLRLHQEQVARLARELNDTRDRMAEVVLNQKRLSGAIEDAEKQRDAGVRRPEEVKMLIVEVEVLKQRQENLFQRESRLQQELDTERAGVLDLNRRLDDMEREMLPPPPGRGRQ